jgi:hypothetical protein
MSATTFSMPKKSAARGAGRPTKLTPAMMARLKEAFALGLTDDQAASVINVSDMTLTTWKRNPAFMAEIRGAVNERLMLRLKRIEAGENGWQGCGWLLERLLPRQWAKPEVLIAVQNNLNVGVGAQNFEALVLEDAQFSKLSQNPNYAHRKPAVEVEASVVPEDVAGTLVRADCPGSAIVSQSQEAENQRRIREADSKIAKLLAAKGKAKNGNGSGSAVIPEPSTGVPGALVPAVIVMPPEPVPESWWAQLVTGDNARQIAKEAAIVAVRRVLRELHGTGRAKGISIEFQSELVTLSDLYSALETLTGGPSGWQTLLKLAGR